MPTSQQKFASFGQDGLSASQLRSIFHWNASSVTGVESGWSDGALRSPAHPRVDASALTSSIPPTSELRAAVTRRLPSEDAPLGGRESSRGDAPDGGDYDGGHDGDYDDASGRGGGERSARRHGSPDHNTRQRPVRRREASQAREETRRYFNQIVSPQRVTGIDFSQGINDPEGKVVELLDVLATGHEALIDLYEEATDLLGSSDPLDRERRAEIVTELRARVIALGQEVFPDLRVIDPPLVLRTFRRQSGPASATTMLHALARLEDVLRQFLVDWSRGA